jgi:hypothetical protein
MPAQGEEGVVVLTIHQSCERGGVKMVNLDTLSVPAGFHTSQPDIHASDRVNNIIFK